MRGKYRDASCAIVSRKPCPILAQVSAQEFQLFPSPVLTQFCRFAIELSRALVPFCMHGSVSLSACCAFVRPPLCWRRFQLLIRGAKVNPTVVGVIAFRSTIGFDSFCFPSGINSSGCTECIESTEDQFYSRKDRRANDGEWMETCKSCKVVRFRDTRQIAPERMVSAYQKFCHRDEFLNTRHMFGFQCGSTQTCEGVEGRTRSRDLGSIEHHWISRGGTCLGGGSEYALANTPAFLDPARHHPCNVHGWETEEIVRRRFLKSCSELREATYRCRRMGPCVDKCPRIDEEMANVEGQCRFS